MVRTFFFIAILLSGMAAKAQVASPSGAPNSAQSTFSGSQQVSDTNHVQKKWLVTKYTGISTGFVAFKGGSGSFLSVPLGLQVSRPLTNNLYAFGSVSVTPYLFHYNNAPYQPAINKNNSLMQVNNFGAYPEAKIGLMYINDERTFSVSGSIGVSRGGYNSYAPFYAPAYAPVRGHNQ